MIISQQTVIGFVQLLFFSFISGIILSLVYSNAALVSLVCSSIKDVSKGCKSFIKSVRKNGQNNVFVAILDFLICVLASCALCALIFVFNSGQFRAMAVVFLLVGFFCGKSLFGNLLIYPIAFIAFVIIKSLYLAGIPFWVLGGFILRIVKTMVAKIVYRRRIGIMKKYTQEQLERLAGSANLDFFNNL